MLGGKVTLPRVAELCGVTDTAGVGCQVVLRWRKVSRARDRRRHGGNSQLRLLRRLVMCSSRWTNAIAVGVELLVGFERKESEVQGGVTQLGVNINNAKYVSENVSMVVKRVSRPPYSASFRPQPKTSSPTRKTPSWETETTSMDPPDNSRTCKLHRTIATLKRMTVWR
jgi:hypothetical protein